MQTIVRRDFRSGKCHPIEERSLIRGEPHGEDVIIKLDCSIIAKRMQQTEPAD